MSAEDRSAAQAAINAGVWASGRYLSSYDRASLQPAEALILARYREVMTGRVLDVGCGAGRILAYLVLLGADAHGIDISSRMVEHCARRFPRVDVRVGDLADLTASVEGPFDAVLLTDNVLDVFDDEQRRRSLADVRDLLAPGGLLVFSGHNLSHWDRASTPVVATVTSRLLERTRDIAKREVGWLARAVLRFPVRRANRRRLAPLQYREDDHAIVNDAAHDFGLLHYYISRADQERQLSELGYRLIDVLEFSGPSVRSGEAGEGSSLYYVAAAAG
ncbi:MAG: methyltransferase domain-containing protein [Solirubrobacteraceae bacterium]